MSIAPFGRFKRDSNLSSTDVWIAGFFGAIASMLLRYIIENAVILAPEWYYRTGLPVVGLVLFWQLTMFAVVFGYAVKLAFFAPRLFEGAQWKKSYYKLRIRLKRFIRHLKDQRLTVSDREAY